MTEEWDDSARAYVDRKNTDTQLPEGLRLRSAWTALDGLVTDGEPRTRFRPQGDATHTYVHLEEASGKEFTVEVRPLLGRPEVTPEWVGPKL